MFSGDTFGLLAGAVVLGAIHGIEPGHGWPVAASYALDQANKWVYGFAASFILGVGHLVSSIAMVGVFFYAKEYFDLTQVNEPITIVGGVQIGGPVSLVAGVLLIALGIREYTHGHSHGSHGEGHGTGHGHPHGSHDHDHSHSNKLSRINLLEHGRLHSHDTDHSYDSDHCHDSDHEHTYGQDDDRLRSRIKRFIPFLGGHSHSHDGLDSAADRGLFGIAWFAFVLGFAHEEEFEIIALCAGSNYCLELMGAYAITVVVGIVGLTMLLIAGYQHYEEKVKQYTPYLPAFSATVLVVMGVGFVFGVF